MAEFNPDAYLAAKTGGGGGFDPDAYLSQVGEPKETPVVQEMHPEFTTADRLVVKNFSNNPEAATNYLQKRHPDLEIKTDPRGQFLARKRDGSEQSYRVLDPDTGISGVGEALRDIGDVGYDVLSGLGTTAATAAGGIAGAAGGGIGALPGAAAAGAGASTGFEGLKQSLGKALGVGDFSGTELAIAGGVGAASPLLFGTGASAAQLAKAGLPEAAALGQRGLIGRAYDVTKESVLPWLAEKASGVSRGAVKTLANNFDELARLEADPNAITNMTKEAASSVGGTLKTAKGAAWKEYQTALDEAGDALVDIAPARDRLTQAIAEADDIAKATGNEASKDLVSELKNQFRRLFMAGDTPVEALPVKAAAKMEQQLGELAQLQKMPAGGLGVGSRFSPTASQASKEMATIAGDMKSALKGSLDEVLPEGALASRTRYGEIANLQKQVKPMFATADKAFKTLRNLDRPSNRAKLELLNRIDKDLGSGAIDKAKMVEAFDIFSKPNALPISSGGTTSTSRSIPLAALGGAGGYFLGRSQEGSGYGTGLLGAGAGALLGGPAAIRQYVRAGLAAERLGSKLPPATGQALGNIWLQMKADKEK